MHERREVDHLHHGRDLHQIRRDLPLPLPAAEKHQGRANPLPGRIDAVLDHRTDLRLERTELLRQKTIEFGHLRTEQPEHRRKRMGLRVLVRVGGKRLFRPGLAANGRWKRAVHASQRP